jgi:alkylation response protein AidB-like acyl-CoA dehydrogenase
LSEGQGGHRVQLKPVSLPEGARALQAEVREFLVEELGDRLGRSVDTWSEHSPEFSRKLGARGWIGMLWPKKYGGHERSVLERFVVTEEMLAAGAPVGSHWIADRQSGPLILRHGTEEQRTRFLPGIAAGEIYFSIGMSEPDAGSDLAAVRTAARKADGGWVINGLKTWTTHGHQAHFMITLCRTSAEEDRHQGLSQLIVDLKAPGIEINPIRYMTGQHHWNEIVFTDVFVPDSMVVGKIGEGWRQVTSELVLERSGPERFMSVYGLLPALVDELGDRPAERSAAALGSLVAQLWTLRRMSMAVAGELESGGSPAIEAALVKDLGTRFEGAVAETARELVPPSARDQESTFEDLLRHVILAKPGFTLRGGTNEILRTVVARGLVGR